MRCLTHNLTFDRLANTVPVVGSQRLLLFHERLKERERKREKEREGMGGAGLEQEGRDSFTRLSNLRFCRPCLLQECVIKSFAFKGASHLFILELANLSEFIKRHSRKCR